MVMSGYLMAYHYMARERKEPVNTFPTAKKFWVRRFFRIAPLYYVVLLGACLVAPAVREGRIILQGIDPALWAQHPIYDPRNIHYTPDNILMHVTFLFGLIPKYASAVFLPDWSIGLEMQFYAAFPLLFLILRRTGYLLTALAGLAVMLAAKHWFGNFPEPSFLPLKLPLFLIGMLAAESHGVFARTSLQRAFAMVLAMALASRQSVYVLAVTVLVISLGASENYTEKDGWLRWPKCLNCLLANRLTRFMADTSYSVYLIHGTFIAILGGVFYQQEPFLHLTPPVRVAILTGAVLVCSYLAGYLLFRFVERPGIQFGRNLVRKMSSKT